MFLMNEGDLSLLRRAKKQELLEGTGMESSDIDHAISWAEILLHVRRSIAPAEQMASNLRRVVHHFIIHGDDALGNLCLQSSYLSDIEVILGTIYDIIYQLGTPLLNAERSEEILASQLHHTVCLQDVEGVSLYTKVGDIMKGGVSVPKYRCARGTTSLESFHAHVANFVPGK